MTATADRGTAAEAAPRTRLLGVDAARGAALLGMIAVHSLDQVDARGGATWTFTVFGGRSAAAFAVLAGVGVAFMTGRRRVDRLRPAAAALATRAAVIGAIGLALGYTDAALAAVILPYYAVLFVLAIPLVPMPTWVIAATGAAAAGAFPVLGHLLRPHLPAATLENQGFARLLQDPLGLLWELTITGEYPALPWMAYLCAGIVIGRVALRRARVAATLLVLGALLAACAQVASSWLLHSRGGLAAIQGAIPRSGLTAAETTDLLTLGGDGTTPTSTWWWLAVSSPHTSTPLDLIGTIGTSMALIGFMLLLDTIPWTTARRALLALRAPLVAAGSMTLTLYTAHVMFINSDHDLYTPTTGYLLQVIVILLLALGWRATAGRGPLEALTAALANRASRAARHEDPTEKGWEPGHPRKRGETSGTSPTPREEG